MREIYAILALSEGISEGRTVERAFRPMPIDKIVADRRAVRSYPFVIEVEIESFARRALSAECPIICLIADSTAHFVGKIDLVTLALQKADISAFKFGMYCH